MNYCKINPDHIEYTVDLIPPKQGLFLPGTNLPIKSPSIIKETKPDYIIILPWNLKKELSSQLRNYKKQGAKFVTFIPKLNIF